MIATVLMSKSVLDITFISLLRSYRPALLSSALMAMMVIGSKTLPQLPDNVLVLIMQVTIGVISYYLATRLLFAQQFQTAFTTVFGNRFSFLGLRPS